MTAPGPSARIEGLPRSGIREVMELALSQPDVIRLEIGDPDFATPEHIVAAAADAARSGFTHYSPGIGLASLRELIAAKVRERNSFSCSSDEVVVTTGACGAIHASLLALLDPGDELLVPDPGWTTLIPMALAAGVVPVPYPLDRSRGFALDAHALAARIGRRAKAVVINSPSNPSGTVASRQDLEAVIEVAEHHGVWILSDECYEELVHDDAHVSAAAVGDPDRIVSVFSFSKTYAMTGWRIGYAIASARIARLLAKAQEPVVSSASTISQKAAEAALTGPQHIVADMREAYRRRRDGALAILEREHIEHVRPGGAFYLMVDITRAGMPALEFVRQLLLNQRVAVVPGDAFGSGGEGMVRISLAASDESVSEGVGRLAMTIALTSASD